MCLADSVQHADTKIIWVLHYLNCWARSSCCISGNHRAQVSRVAGGSVIFYISNKCIHSKAIYFILKGSDTYFSLNYSQHIGVHILCNEQPSTHSSSLGFCRTEQPWRLHPNEALCLSLPTPCVSQVVDRISASGFLKIPGRGLLLKRQVFLIFCL